MQDLIQTRSVLYFYLTCVSAFWMNTLCGAIKGWWNACNVDSITWNVCKCRDSDLHSFNLNDEFHELTFLFHTNNIFIIHWILHEAGVWKNRFQEPPTPWIYVFSVKLGPWKICLRIVLRNWSDSKNKGNLWSLQKLIVTMMSPVCWKGRHMCYF